MESEIQSGEMVKMIVPVKYEITIEQVENKKYRIKYKEVTKRPEQIAKEMFKQVAIASKRFAEQLGNCTIEGEFVDDDTYILKFEIEDSFEKIATIVASEFLMFSPLGRVTLLDLYILAGAGLLYAKEKLGEIEEKVEIVEEMIERGEE